MMLEELERRNYSAGTIRYYVRFVERFAQHFGKSPDQLGPDHVRIYQSYLLKQRKLSPGTVEHHVSALRFFYVQTLHRHEFRQLLPYPKVRQKLPKILSREEVARLIEASSGLFCRWHEHCSLNRDAILCRCCSCLTAHHGTAPAAEKPCTSLSATPQQNSTSQASIPHDHCCQPAPPTCSSHVYPEVCLPPNQLPH